MRTGTLTSFVVLMMVAPLGVDMAAQGGGRGGGRGGFNLPPLLMQTEAFADGGIVPSENAMLDLPATAGRDELLKAMAGKVTAKAAYVGRYRGGE